VGGGNGGDLNAVRGSGISITGVDGRRGKEGCVARVAVSGRERGKGGREGAGATAGAF
jgi:hypothetical protein